VQKFSIDFVKVGSPINDATTKFGGQPVWIEKPQWPLSRETGNPMRFICQIALDAELFAGSNARMAYIFMTDEDEFVDGTWEPDGGENAVILQPGQNSAFITDVPTGPTLYEMVESVGDRLVPKSCEFRAELFVDWDPPFIPERERRKMNPQDLEDYANSLVGNKIGGTPWFLQGDEFPSGTGWRLLLQLDSTKVPFSINFGDAGIGYVFLNERGESARFLWQCC
jgi:uncharacterized protein YwqG